MRSKRGAYIAVVVGLIISLLASLNRPSTGQAQANKAAVAWEYKTLDWGGGDPTPSLNDLGAQGWELVTSRGYGHQFQSLFFFKRAKP
jgi:Domain of unknown function (DUF4177)